MDEKNNTINNAGNQGNMSYSFDFANQVDNTTPVQNNAQTSTVETLNASTATPTPAPETLNASTATPTPAPETLNASTVTPTPAPETLNASTVTPTPAPETLNASTVTPTPAPETLNASTVTPTPVAPTMDVPASGSSVASEVTNAAMPGVTPVVLVTPETVMAQNKEDENIELIKDKKATKNFLIVLFVLLIIFIIALPFIFQIMG